MTEVLPSLILAMTAIGHGGLHIAMYNRINGFGWRRRLVKRFVKVFLFTTVAIPTLVIVTQSGPLLSIIQGQPAWDELAMPTLVYGWICLASWLFLGIPWIMWRPILGLESVGATREIESYDVADRISCELTMTRKSRFFSKLPLNQISELSIEHVDLPVAGLPEQLDGYRIAHLSDIHLTGHLSPEYAKHAVQVATDAKPDLMTLTGDIIDKQPCIDWLGDIFSSAKASDGCYFILGNHDTRVINPTEIRDAMRESGWTNLGVDPVETALAGVPSQIIGNEWPWFARPNIEPTSDRFRLLLSHSPDQLSWARRNHVQLMLAGHTHGGQGRLPLVGPILSPSFHGSRYASGDFYRVPTTMHVTRGLGGVHLVRINCRPELSLLTLRMSR